MNNDVLFSIYKNNINYMKKVLNSYKKIHFTHFSVGYLLLYHYLLLYKYLKINKKFIIF